MVKRFLVVNDRSEWVLYTWSFTDMQIIPKVGTIIPYNVHSVPWCLYEKTDSGAERNKGCLVDKQQVRVLFFLFPWLLYSSVSSVISSIRQGCRYIWLRLLRSDSYFMDGWENICLAVLGYIKVQNNKSKWLKFLCRDVCTCSKYLW